MAKWQLRAIVDLTSSIAMGVAALTLVWLTLSGRDEQARDEQVRIRRPASPSVEDIRHLSLVTTLDGVPATGRRDSLIALIEFGDFQCPFCGRFARDVFSQVQRELIDTGKVEYAFRSFPLEHLHAVALPAAIAADCAGRQGRFWEMRAFLYANQADLPKAVWLKPPVHVGLNTGELLNCTKKSDESRIRSDIAEGSRLGVMSTPTVLIGEKLPDRSVRVTGRLRGAGTFQALKEGLEKLHASQGT